MSEDNRQASMVATVFTWFGYATVGLGGGATLLVLIAALSSGGALSFLVGCVMAFGIAAMTALVWAMFALGASVTNKR